MARGTTLAVIRSMLNGELGNSTAANAARDAEYNVLISNMQKWLATEYEWPFLERRWDVVVQPNTQYVTLPTVDDAGVTCAINMERYPRFEVRWSTSYQDVGYGIGKEEYNTSDFSLGQQNDPIQKWRVSSNVDEAAGPNQFEVWPVPVTKQTIRITGQRALLTLAADADVADLDDMLLVMAVAADKLTRAKQADAAVKTEKFKRRLAWVRQAGPSRDVRRVLGGGNDFYKRRKIAGMTIIVK